MSLNCSVAKYRGSDSLIIIFSGWNDSQSPLEKHSLLLNLHKLFLSIYVTWILILGVMLLSNLCQWTVRFLNESSHLATEAKINFKPHASYLGVTSWNLTEYEKVQRIHCTVCLIQNQVLFGIFLARPHNYASSNII